MASLPKGIQRVTKRRSDGTEAVYWYWRPTRTKLPDPASPEFPEALRRAKLAFADRPDAGTFAALVLDYKRSPGFRDMKPGTRKAYDRALYRLKGLGRVQVAEIRRSHILELRDALALTAPQAANHMVMVLGVLMAFAVEREWREANPCARIGRLRGGHYKRWSEADIAYALKAFPEKFRRAVLLALYTGQREGDCLQMRWDQYDGTAIEAVIQQKTGARLWLPVHKELKRELDGWSRSAEMILTSANGKPWQIGSFATLFTREMDNHPRLAGLVFHGLRKSAAARLAEAGCSTHEIAAITGHASLDMIELYTKEASQRRRATAAIRRLELVSDAGLKPLQKTPVTD